MEYVLANLEGSNFKIFLARRPQPWWGLLIDTYRHYIEVKFSLSWPLHFLLLACIEGNMKQSVSCFLLCQQILFNFISPFISNHMKVVGNLLVTDKKRGSVTTMVSLTTELKQNEFIQQTLASIKVRIFTIYTVVSRFDNLTV